MLRYRDHRAVTAGAWRSANDGVRRRDRGRVGARICVFALVLGVCFAANAASALADSINTPTVIGGTPQSGKQMQFSFTGSADASGTWLEVLVRPTGPIGCQSTFDNDQAAVPGSNTIYNRNYTVGPGQFTAPATYTPYTRVGSTRFVCRLRLADAAERQPLPRPAPRLPAR